MEQKDYKKILRKIQLSANMFIDQNMFAGWVYSMIATELDENAHWNFISTELLEEFNKEIDNELRRRRGEQVEDKKKQEPASQLPIKTRKSLKGATIYPPAPAVMEKVSPKVKAAYEPDDGPLTDKQTKQIKKLAKKQLPEMTIVKKRVAEELKGFSDAFKVRDKMKKAKKKAKKTKTKSKK
jgi:hypothetical protein